MCRVGRSASVLQRLGVASAAGAAKLGPIVAVAAAGGVETSTRSCRSSSRLAEAAIGAGDVLLRLQEESSTPQSNVEARIRIISEIIQADAMRHNAALTSQPYYFPPNV